MKVASCSPPDEGKRRANEEDRMNELRCKVLIIGGGPGGYVAAIRAGELGLDTVLVEDGTIRRRLPACRLHPLESASSTPRTPRMR